MEAVFSIGAALFGIAVVIAVVAWLRRRRRRFDPYDLSRLNDPDPGEPWEEAIDDESGPYCHACDHQNPSGVRVCTSCGRRL
jgi:hypothetical protein